MDTNDLIDNIKSGDVAKSNNIFNSIMKDKINDALDAKKQEVASSVYGVEDEAPETDADV